MEPKTFGVVAEMPEPKDRLLLKDLKVGMRIRSHVLGWVVQVLDLPPDPVREDGTGPWLKVMSSSCRIEEISIGDWGLGPYSNGKWHATHWTEEADEDSIS